VADKSGSSVGAVVGAAIAVILTAGMVGSPFYLGLLQSEDAGLEAAVSADVEHIRRVVLGAQPHMEALARLSDALRTDGLSRADSSSADVDERAATLDEASLRGLEQTAALIHATWERDWSRGTMSATDTPAANARLDVAKEAAGVKALCYAANQKLRQDAETAVNSLRAMKHGTQLAGSHVAVARVAAIYFQTVSRMHANRALFEEKQAALLRASAYERLRDAADVRLRAEVLAAQVPDHLSANVAQMQAAIDGQIAAHRHAVSGLEQQVASLQEECDAAEQTALELRQALAELSIARATVSAVDREQYLDTSAELREVEAKAATLRNGTLRDAERIDARDPDALPMYEGGTPQIGLRDLMNRLAQGREVLAAMERMAKTLHDQASFVESQRSALGREIAECDAVARRHADAAQDFHAKARSHAQAAKQAWDDYYAASKTASSFAQNAVTATRNRSRDAAASMSSGHAVDERLDRIKKDGDTEAAAHCLRAEVAFEFALAKARQLEALQDEHEAEALIADASSAEASTPLPADVVQNLKAQAVEALALAAKEYGEAEKLLLASSIKTPTGTISGRDYAWQTQIGQAAAQLLKSTIAAAVGGKPDREAQDAAAALLTKAAEGREQSPQLTTALATLEYLQKTVK